MISAEVGPPSSMVAAWITHLAGISPAVVATASPRSIGARSSLSFCTSGPPAREIAAATPPSVIRSKLRPTSHMTRIVTRIVNGITTVATSVVPQLRRKP